MLLSKRLSSKKVPELAIVKELPKNSMVINSSLKSTVFV